MNQDPTRSQTRTPAQSAAILKEVREGVPIPAAVVFCGFRRATLEGWHTSDPGFIRELMAAERHYIDWLRERVQAGREAERQAREARHQRRVVREAKKG